MLIARPRCDISDNVCLYLHDWRYFISYSNVSFDIGLLVLNNISFYLGSQFCWWRKPEYMEKITDLSYVTDKRFCIPFCFTKAKNLTYDFYDKFQM